MAAESGPKAAKAQHIAIFGQKGTGKTELADLLWRSYPYDKLRIDPNRDMIVPEEAIELSDPPPARWPARAELEERASEHTRHPRYFALTYAPDFGDPGYADNLDRAIGLAYTHAGKKAVFVDEAHDAFPAGQMQKRPHARRALRHGRHATLTLILATPRPMTIDPLCISQADWVYVFKLRSASDRKRVSENIGWDAKEFDAAVHGLGDHEFLRYESAANAGEGELCHFPALPEELILHHKS